MAHGRGDASARPPAFAAPAQAATRMDELEPLRRRLETLKQEHRDLDDVIARITEDGGFDQLQVQRLKKRKLVLKDQIIKLESELHPDIIA
jgi:hypothetical protein